MNLLQSNISESDKTNEEMTKNTSKKQKLVRQ